MTTTAYKVTGMTCEHCANAVTSEVSALSGVAGVQVQLVPNGVSTVTVTSAAELPEAEVSAALDEAGGYQLGSLERATPPHRVRRGGPSVAACTGR
jgi:copper chaperone